MVPRVLRTPFVDRWQSHPEEARARAEDLRSEIMGVVARRAPHELVPFTGQTAGLVRDVLPAAEIVVRMIGEAEKVLADLTRS